MIDYKIINIEDKEYPEKLRNIDNPPKKLYLKGNINLLYKDMFAVVGTRKITEYGKKHCKRFCKELALRNIPIISGMAVGTDTLAHKTALQYGALTIAVLGTGINTIYPEENKNLYKEILNSKGLIISEVDPNKLYNSKTFPKRNRIISGLSEGVLAVEAAYRSGTSITVKYAKEQGKNVFAIPANLESKYGVGVNNFIKEGAMLVTNINDILKHYPQFLNKKCKTNELKKVKNEYLQIYEILENNSCSIDEISKHIKNKTIREITSVLTMMELEDLIVQDVGIGYKIKEDNA